MRAGACQERRQDAEIVPPPPPLAAPRPRARLYTHLALAQTHIHPVYTHPGAYTNQVAYTHPALACTHPHAYTHPTLQI